MAVTVKKITLWRREVENKPGVLGGVLAPLAEAGADLQVVMGYRHAGDGSKAAIEVSPVTGKKSLTAARGRAGRLVDPHVARRGGQQARFGSAISQAIAGRGSTSPSWWRRLSAQDFRR